MEMKNDSCTPYEKGKSGGEMIKISELGGGEIR